MTTAFRHPRSASQNRRYWQQIQALGLRGNDEARRGILFQAVGKESSKDLTKGQMRTVIDYQEYLLGHRPAPPISVSSGATVEQRELIHSLERDLDWADNPDRLRGFVRKMTHERVEDVDRLKRSEASQVIEGLKSMRGQDRHRIIHGPWPAPSPTTPEGAA